MSKHHWHRNMLYFIGKVVNLEVKGKKLVNILVLDMSLDEQYIFFHTDCGYGYKGFIGVESSNNPFLTETDKKPAYKVSIPASQQIKNLETL